MDRTTRNVLACALPELLWGFASAVTVEGAMPSAFSDAFGGSPRFVGIVGLVNALCMGLPMLFTAWVVEPLGRKRGVVLFGHLATGSVYGVIALLIHLAGPVGDDAVRAAYLGGGVVFFSALGFLFPVWLALIGELVPEGSRGRVLGIIFLLNRVGGWAGGETAHALLSTTWAPADRWSCMFLLAMGAAVIGALPFAWVVEPEVPRHARPPLGAYVRKIARGFVGRAALRRFVTADLLAVTGVVVIWQFGAVALGRFGIDRSWAGRWTAITAAAQLTAALAILLLGHRLLPRRGLTFGALAMGAGAAVAAFARTPAAFALVGALGGTFYTIRIVLHSPQVMRLCAGRDVTGPIGLAMALSSLVTGLGPFAAGWAIPAFGHRAVFLGVACACLTAAILLARWVPDRGELPVD